MKFLTYLTSVVAVATAAAVPNRRGQEWQNCLSQAEAENLVGQYMSILEHSPSPQAANATAQALLDNNYQEISDSILSLEGLPLGGVTFNGKQEYIEGTLSGPPVSGVNTIDVLVANCNRILWQWVFTGIGSKEYEIKGFNLFTVTPANQLSTTYIEFNSIAWGLDTGYQVIFPPAGSKPT